MQLQEVETRVDIPLLQGRQAWECPNCGLTEVTAPLPPGSSRYHACPGLHGLNAPLVPAGTRCKITAAVRDDYLSGDVQATGDDGRPYMNIRVTYDDKPDDLTVNAGLARAEIRM